MFLEEYSYVLNARAQSQFTKSLIYTKIYTTYDKDTAVSAILDDYLSKLYKVNTESVSLIK